MVSVVIPTFNSERFLEECLRSVRGQTYSNVEVIVVDNYSTDGTRKIAERYGAKTLLKGPERSAQMNHGVINAGGEYILRVDFDMAADEDLIEKCIKLCRKQLMYSCGGKIACAHLEILNLWLRG